jgi:hypothetical protein
MGAVSVKPGTWKGRRSVTVSNGAIEAVFLPGGAHIASAIMVGGKAVNPLWEVPWPTMDPEKFVASRDLDNYGGPPEGRLLASIMGHNLCMDYFGPPSPEEGREGWTVHGEASLAEYSVEPSGSAIDARTTLVRAGLRLRRLMTPAAGGAALKVETLVTNIGPARQIGWQEHATFGPPFVAGGDMVTDASAGWGQEPAYAYRMKAGAEFTWPSLPLAAGGTTDIRPFPAGPASGDFSAQLMDPSGEWAWFTCVNAGLGLLAGYIWPLREFPWLGMWEENLARAAKPWNNRTVTRGLEFGVSPFAHGKAPMLKLKSLHGTPVLEGIAAGASLRKTFWLFLAPVPRDCSGVDSVAFDGRTISLKLRPGSAEVAVSAG